MGFISTQEARGLFTKKLIAVYLERTAPTSFLRSFFRNVESNTKQISIEVRRGTEKIAVDVERGTEGNRNQFSRSSEKIFVPPYYREYFDATDLDFYERLFVQDGTVDVVTFSQWLSDIVEKIGMLQDKIERTYELKVSEVFETGIVTLNSGTNIDFKRKAASLVPNSGGNTWATGTVSPYDSLKAGAKFIRTKGKSASKMFDVLMGDTAHTDFLENDIVLARADIRNFSLDALDTPQANAVGGVLHGVVSAGSYRFRLWTYPEFFDTETEVNKEFLNPKKIVILPQNPNFVMAFAAVPQLLGKKPNVGAGLATSRGAFMIGEYLDERNSAHIIDIKSAGVPVPVAVDQIYTEQVVA